MHIENHFQNYRFGEAIASQWEHKRIAWLQATVS